MSDRTAANSINGQGDQGGRNEVRQTQLTNENTARLNSEHNNDLPERRQQIDRQELDLNYYRTFLEDLVAVMRDAHSDSVAQLVSLIRSGASNEDIHNTLRRVQDES